MPENKSANLKSFLFVKAGAITDVPSTRTFSCLAILSWVFSGVIFIRYIRSHLTYLIHRPLSQTPFIGPYSVHPLLSHLSGSAPIYFICTTVSFTHFLRYTPLFSFRTFPEQFKGMFWAYPRPLWKSVGEPVVMRCILLGIFTEK